MAAPVGHILCLDKLESVDTLCVCDYCNQPRVFLCCSSQLRQNGINLPIQRDYVRDSSVLASIRAPGSGQILSRFFLFFFVFFSTGSLLLASLCSGPNKLR